MDDGCDLVTLLHTERREQLGGVLAGTEETTTGVIRLRAMAADGALEYPVIAVNEAQTKHLFDNRYGTGQSTVDGILRATNILIAGRRVVVAGYGWVGRGIASRMRGMGAQVAIVEVDPIRALEALMDGYQVMTAAEAAPWGDLFVTATGNVNVFRREHFERWPTARSWPTAATSTTSSSSARWRRWPTATAARSGPTSRNTTSAVEAALRARRGPPGQPRRRRGPPGRGDGHELRQPGARAEYLAKHHAELAKQVYVVPDEIDSEVARLKLEALGRDARRADRGAGRVRQVLAERDVASRRSVASSRPWLCAQVSAPGAAVRVDGSVGIRDPDLSSRNSAT